MTRERDVEHVLRSWIEEGADLAPERFVWSALEAVETTPQRGAWQASLEGLIMKLKPAAPILGVAAAIVIALAAYQFLGGRNVGEEGPAPRVISASDLPIIVPSILTLPDGWTIDGGQETKGAVLSHPTRSANGTELALAEAGSLVAGRFIEGGAPGGIYTAWSALFQDESDAERALAIYLAEFESEDAWDLAASEDVALGDEGTVFTGDTTQLVRGEPGEPVRARIYVWRIGNLLLAAASFFDVDEQQLQAVAEAMDDRAH